MKWVPGSRPTNCIWVEFEIRRNFAVLWFKMSSTDHNEILHTLRQCYYAPNFDRISNSIEISLVGRAPGPTIEMGSRSSDQKL